VTAVATGFVRVPLAVIHATSVLPAVVAFGRVAVTVPAAVTRAVGDTWMGLSVAMRDRPPSG
jgi:hypothetical protein